MALFVSIGRAQAKFLSTELVQVSILIELTLVATGKEVHSDIATHEHVMIQAKIQSTNR